MRHIPLAPILVFLLAISASADSMNPIIDFMPGDTCEERGTLVRTPDRKGYLLSFQMICPVQTISIPVTVATDLRVDRLLGEPKLITVRVDEGPTFTVTDITEIPPPPPPVGSLIAPPATPPSSPLPWLLAGSGWMIAIVLAGMRFRASRS